MAILYSTVAVKTNGIFSVEEFTPPIDGRVLKVECPGGYLNNKIYTCIDGDLVGPYKKPNSVDTGIGIHDFLTRDLHSAYIFVVNDSETVLDDITYTPHPREIRISGRTVSIKLIGRLNVSIRVKNSDFLIRDYWDRRFTSAETRASGILKHLFKEEIDHFIDDVNAKDEDDFYKLSGQLDTEAQEIQKKLSQKLSHTEYISYPWIDIVDCKCALYITNRDEIIKALNYGWKTGEKIRKKIFKTDEKIRLENAKVTNELKKTLADALVRRIIDGALPTPLTDIVNRIITCNPEISTDEILKVTEEIMLMNIKYSRETLSEVDTLKENTLSD